MYVDTNVFSLPQVLNTYPLVALGFRQPSSLKRPPDLQAGSTDIVSLR